MIVDVLSNNGVQKSIYSKYWRKKDHDNTEFYTQIKYSEIIMIIKHKKKSQIIGN